MLEEKKVKRDKKGSLVGNGCESWCQERPKGGSEETELNKVKSDESNLKRREVSDRMFIRLEGTGELEKNVNWLV